MNRRAVSFALLLGLWIICGCEAYECIPPGCDCCCQPCCDPPCHNWTPCGPCGPEVAIAAESRPGPDTRTSEDLVAALRTKDRAEREHAIAAIAARGTEVLPQMEALLSDQDANIRYDALQVLIRLRQDAWPTVYHVKYRLHDCDPAVRAEAATVIGLFGCRGADAVPELIGAMRDPSEIVRYRAAVALQGMDTFAEPARTTLENACRCDRDARVREAACCAVWKLDKAQHRNRDVYGR